MAVIKVGIRSGETANWNVLRQREALTGNPGRVRAGDSPDALQRLVALRGANLAERIGVVFKKIETPNGFIYQGQRSRIETFEMDETVFTIGKMRKLLELAGDEVRKIFTVPGYSIDEVITKSLSAIAKDVPETERDNCPLVYVSQIEAERISQLVIGESLPAETQWERAASGTDGKKRPWGDDLDRAKAVYGDSGTRPVKSKPAGVSAEGLYDLIGNVWEWTKESVLRGGSWYYDDVYYLQADYHDLYHPENRGNSIGFRLARTSKG